MNSLPIQNSLLRRFSPGDVGRLGALDRITLGLRQMLQPANQPGEYIYFIEDGLASVVLEATAGGATEIGIIGREGMTGIGVFYGDIRSPFDTFMQIEGAALRCETSRLQEAMAHSEAVRSVVAGYARAYSIQVASTAVANGRAKLEERLARWLLMVSDRMGATFRITHEFMAVMLAVRRSGVTLGIQSLEGRSLIRAGRGAIRIIDRTGLIDASKGAYGLPEREYQRLLGVDTF